MGFQLPRLFRSAGKSRLGRFKQKTASIRKCCGEVSFGHRLPALHLCKVQIRLYLGVLGTGILSLTGETRYKATKLGPQAIAVMSCLNENTLVFHHRWPKTGDFCTEPMYFVITTSQKLSAPPRKTISSKYFLRLSYFNNIPPDTI